MNGLDIVDKSSLYNTYYFLLISESMMNYSICSNKSILMICVNIRSIKANLDEFILYLQNDTYFNLEIIVLTEYL